MARSPSHSHAACSVVHTHRSLTRAERPCSSTGTTVESKYVRMGAVCKFILFCTPMAAFSAPLACGEPLETGKVQAKWDLMAWKRGNHAWLPPKELGFGVAFASHLLRVVRSRASLRRLQRRRCRGVLWCVLHIFLLLCAFFLRRAKPARVRGVDNVCRAQGETCGRVHGRVFTWPTLYFY